MAVVVVVAPLLKVVVMRRTFVSRSARIKSERCVLSHHSHTRVGLNARDHAWHTKVANTAKERISRSIWCNSKGLSAALRLMM